MTKRMTDRTAHSRRVRGEEAGMTLIELIVAVLITALLLGAVASLFASGLRSESATRDRDTATGAAQVVTESLHASIRNAAEVLATGNLLRAVVATGSTGWECRAWALVGDELRYRTSAAPIGTDATTWTVLARGVSGTLEGGVPFTNDGRLVTIGVAVTAGAASVPVTAGVAAQARAEGPVIACW